MAAKDKSYRVLLPADVVPEHYDLTLEPNLETFTFDGVVKITCDVQVSTEQVVVHAKELLISSASFTPSEGGAKAMAANEITLKVKEMTASMGFQEFLPVGKGVLEIKFRGFLNDQMAGFYRSQYTDSKGVKRHMATTQFEAIDARRSFPCWDEPGRKAVFVVTMVYPAELMCLSNMPQSRSEMQKDGRRRETFMPTPKMSTYLLAYCVGEFEYISRQTANGTMARIFCVPGSAARCSYALDCCVQALEFYDKFFSLPYPLPKMDMIAIPDFSAGAMENWGLVTYREVTLLCDEKTVSAFQKQRICEVIAHELAHQWFGNLVTMEWWDDLWLNEGFANFMQTFASDFMNPEWASWEKYVGSEQQQALSLDALRSSHPIQVPIGPAEEVEEVFDAISYCKGGGVVRMAFAVLGADKFQEGLKLYFQRHKYGNTETSDLWAVWSEVSGKPIHEMMGSWTGQMGFPVVKVLTDPLEGGGAAEVEVEQSWFIADGSSKPKDEDKLWVIPMLVGSDKGKTEISFVDKKKQKLSLGSCAAGASWLKLNFGQHVLARVLYPMSMLERLAANVKSLDAQDKIGLLSDALALCKAGMLAPLPLVKLLKGFEGETNDKVWLQLDTVLGVLNRVVSGLEDATVAAFTKMAAKLVSPAFASVGWEVKETDSDNTRKLRGTLASAVAHYCYTDPALVAEARRLFDAFVANPTDSAALHADIRPSVLSMVMRAESGDKVFEQVLAAHDTVTDGATRIHLYSALGNAQSPALRKKALDFVLSDAVRAQDLIYVPMSTARNGKEGAQTAFDWVRNDYDRIYARLGSTSMMLFQHVVRISGQFSDAGKAAEVEAFWKSKAVYNVVSKTLSQTIEGIVSNASFVERFKSSELVKPEAWE